MHTKETVKDAHIIVPAETFLLSRDDCAPIIAQVLKDLSDSFGKVYSVPMDMIDPMGSDGMAIKVPCVCLQVYTNVDTEVGNERLSLIVDRVSTKLSTSSILYTDFDGEGYTCCYR